MNRQWGHWLVLGGLLSVTAYAMAEDITLTTYYPSPRGMYEELRTTGAVYFEGGSGDADNSGTRDSADATVMLQYLDGLLPLMPIPQKAQADMDGDGRITRDDVTMVLGMEAGFFASKEAARAAVHRTYGSSYVASRNATGFMVDAPAQVEIIARDTANDGIILRGKLTSTNSDGTQPFFSMGTASGVPAFYMNGKMKIIHPTSGVTVVETTATGLKLINGKVTIDTGGGGTITLNAGTNTVNGDLTVNGTLTSTSTTSTGPLTVNGDLTVDGNGDFGAHTVTATSDARFKTNIMPLVGVLDRLEQVHSVSFEWNDLSRSLGYQPDGTKQIGIIAQELETVFPELVSSSGSGGYLAVDYLKLNAVLLEAIKELRQEQTLLKQRVAELEADRSRPSSDIEQSQR